MRLRGAPEADPAAGAVRDQRLRADPLGEATADEPPHDFELPGAVLTLDAAAAGLPITRLALFEPPFVVDDARPPAPADYVQRLDAAVAADRPGDRALSRPGRPGR